MVSPCRDLFAAPSYQKCSRCRRRLLVYAQEYLAEFVDWAGVGFFAREKLLSNGEPVPYPARCDAVFAVIDTASKTGTEHDATAVTFSR